MTITILTDSDKSWFIPHGNELLNNLVKLGHTVFYVHNAADVVVGDICFLLSCTKLVSENTLLLNKNNIVVHASDLPKGKGFSPLQWQILEGKKEICLTLFEVVNAVDAGPFYSKADIQFSGYELYEELREILAKKIICMCLEYVQNRDVLKPIMQVGPESFYKRRTDKDDEIDINKSIYELFNHFRIADNQNYPLYFNIDGRKYFIRIQSDSNNLNIEK